MEKIVESLKLLLDDYDVYMAGGKSLFDWSNKDLIFKDGYGISQKAGMVSVNKTHRLTRTSIKPLDF